MRLQIRCAAIGAMALLMLAGCSASASHGEQTAELKIYDVPPQQGVQISVALMGMGAQGGNVRATLLSPGKLLVSAPASTQDSVSEVLRTLAKITPVAIAPVQVDVHFWVIDAESGAGNDDPALKDLAGSLASLRKATGPMHFHLDQAASLVGTSNDTGNLVTADGPYTRNFSFRVNAVNGDTSKLTLSYEDNGGHGLRKLDTQIDAIFGQYIVLAQAPGACPQASTDTTAATCPDKPAMRLLVVRVDRLNQTA